jgi:hypothetical protein
MAAGDSAAHHRVALSARPVLPVDVLVLRLSYLGGSSRRARRRLRIGASLRNLVSRRIDRRLKVDHVHFGGGTPSIMAPESFADLIGAIRQALFVLPSAEIAIEIDPRTLEPAMIDALAFGGVNRASLGAQPRGLGAAPFFLRHARACAGHRRLALRRLKTWMAGTSPRLSG